VIVQATMMKSLVLCCILGVVATTGGSIDTRDAASNEKQVDFINNGVVNTFSGLPVGKSEQPKLDSLLEISDSSTFVTLAFINVTYYDSNGKENVKNDVNEQSKYGMGRVMDVQGKLVHVSDAENLDDHTGCNTSLLDSFGHKLPTGPWIALIKRGNCDFEKKILHVYQQRAIGAIIYNNISGHDMNYMKITNKELLEGNITSIFTPRYKGEQMADYINTFEQVVVSIKAGQRMDRKSALNHRSSVLFVTISFIIVMVISMLWLVVYYYQRFRYLQTKENQDKLDSNKAREALKKIPTKTIKTLSKVSC